MCIQSSTRLLSSHCFDFLEKADKRASSLGGCCGYAAQAITRLFLLVVIPTAIALDVLHTSLATLMIFPLCYLGVKQHLKNMATAWILVPLTPVVMLLYLVRGIIFKDVTTTASAKRISDHQAPVLPKETAEPPSESDSHKDCLFSAPTNYPRTPICNAIAAHDWRETEAIFHQNQELAQKRIQITWECREMSVTLLEFLILMSNAELIKEPIGLHLLTRIQGVLHGKPTELLSNNPALVPPVMRFIQKIFNRCNEKDFKGSDSQNYLYLLLFAQFVHAKCSAISQDQSLEETTHDTHSLAELEQSLMPILRKSYSSIDKLEKKPITNLLRSTITSVYEKIHSKFNNPRISADRIALIDELKIFPSALIPLIDEYVIDPMLPSTPAVN